MKIPKTPVLRGHSVHKSKDCEESIPVGELSRWRTVRRGLNVEGICRNSGCAAHGKMVIDCKGMVAFSLLADKAHCPECHTQFQPTTCGFYDCMWAFDGRKEGKDGPEDVSGNWKVELQTTKCTP